MLKKNIKCLNSKKPRRRVPAEDNQAFLSAPSSPNQAQAASKCKIPKHIQQIFDSQERNYIDNLLRKKLGLQQKTKEYKFNERLKDFKNLASWKNLKQALEHRNVMSDQPVQASVGKSVLQDRLEELKEQLGKFVQVEDEDYFYYLENQKQSAQELISQTKQQIQFYNHQRQQKAGLDEISSKLISHIQGDLDTHYPQYNELFPQPTRTDKVDEKQLQKEKIVRQIMKNEQVKASQITSAIRKQQNSEYTQLCRAHESLSGSNSNRH